MIALQMPPFLPKMKILQETISLKFSNFKFVCEFSSQISIFQITENQKTLVAKLNLKANYFKFYVKQQLFDVENLSISAKEIGPEFYYQDFAFTALVNDTIYFYYYTDDNMLVSMHKKIDEAHAMNVVAADCILGQDVAYYAILSTQKIYILHCRPNFITDGNM
jgi:hypothetical protein